MLTDRIVRLCAGGTAIGTLALALATPALAQSNEQQSPAHAGAANAAADAAASANQDNNAGQPGATPQASDGGEIVVTAQFRAQRLQDTPIAITAMSGAALEARNQTSVIDVGAFSPNVNLTAATSISSNAIAAFIRGVGQSDSNFALEPGVGIYVDDVYYGTTFGANLDLTDLDRVEVLRGPQGTLAGKNSVGGAVKLFSKKPDGTGGGFVEATYGRFNRIDVRGSANLTLADGLYARVSGVSKHVGGFLTDLDFGCVNPSGGIAASPKAGSSCVIGHEGGTDVKAGRLALRYAPTGSRLEVNLIGDVSIDESQPVATKLIYANNPGVRSYNAANPAGGVPFDTRFITGPESYTSYATFSNGGNYTTVFGFPISQTPGTYDVDRTNTAKGYGVSGTIDYDLGSGLSVKSITAYRKVTGQSGVDVDGSPLDILLEGYDLSHKQFTEELRLSGKVGTFADFTVGGFYYDADDRVKDRIAIPNVLFDFLSNDPVSNKSKSVFGHLELHPAEGLNIIGGIRYTDDKKIYTFSRRNIDGSAISGVPLTTNFLVFGLDGLKGTYKKDIVDYRVGVNYRFNDQIMTYAQVSTGFKGGGVNPRPYVAAQVLPFGPEKLTTYEVGFKADLLDRLLRANGALFYNKYNDIQLNLYVCPESPGVACSRPANAGDAHVKGAELEVQLHPARGLTFEGSVGYLDFDYTRVDPATNVTLNMVAPFNNKWQASGSVEYAAPLGEHGTLTPRLDWTYQSSFYYNAVNTAGSRIAGRSLLNARISYESPSRDWMVSGFVTNLTKKFYYLGVNENIVNYGVNTAVVGRPREWGVTVRRKF